MSAQNARPRQHRCDTSFPGPVRPIHHRGEKSGNPLTEVVPLEHALKRALVPLATSALARERDVVCEVLPDVGEYVLGDRRHLMDLVARLATKAMGAAGRGDLCVRVARQYVGLAPSDTVLLSVSIRDGDTVEDIACVDVPLPVAERAEDPEAATELAAVRILLVVPTMHAARVHSETARRFGARVESALDASLVHERMRDASRSGAPFDVLYLDDRAPHVTTLLRATEASSNVRRILATAAADSPLRRAFAAAVSHTISKPVLPRELCDAIGLVCGANDPQAAPDPADDEDLHTTSVLRRRSGLRNMRLAAVLASLAVTPVRNAR